jgi:dihydropyrimidinase
MQLLYQGVVAGELTLERWVETCATTPAKMFGLHPRKGELAPGADADVVVYDPRGTTVLSAATHHMNVDYSAFEGIEVAGSVATVISRGEVIVDDAGFHGRPGRGRYLKRGLGSYLR